MDWLLCKHQAYAESRSCIYMQRMNMHRMLLFTLHVALHMPSHESLHSRYTGMVLQSPLSPQSNCTCRYTLCRRKHGEIVGSKECWF